MNIEFAKPELFIVSACQADASAEQNEAATSELENALKRFSIPAKKVVGSYKGHREISFLFVKDGNIPDIVAEIAVRYNQETYLWVSADRKDARLVYPIGGHSMRVGEFKQVTEREASRHDAWTLDIEANQFYICE